MFGFFLFLVCVSLHVCMCTMCAPDARGGHKKVFDSLGLGLWVIMNHPLCGCWEPIMGSLQDQRVLLTT